MKLSVKVMLVSLLDRMNLREVDDETEEAGEEDVDGIPTRSLFPPPLHSQ